MRLVLLIPVVRYSITPMITQRGLLQLYVIENFRIGQNHYLQICLAALLVLTLLDLRYAIAHCSWTARFFSALRNRDNENTYCCFCQSRNRRVEPVKPKCYICNTTV